LETFLQQYPEEREFVLDVFGLSAAWQGHREQVGEVVARDDLSEGENLLIDVRNGIGESAVIAELLHDDSVEEGIVHPDQGGAYVGRDDILNMLFERRDIPHRRPCIVPGWTWSSTSTEAERYQQDLQKSPDCEIPDKRTQLQSSRFGQGGHVRPLETQGRILTTVPQGEELEEMCDDPDVHIQTVNEPDSLVIPNQRVTALEDRIRTIESELSSLLIRGSVQPEQADFEGLSSDQIEAFQNLRQLLGTDQNAQRRAEEELATIVGTPLTKAVIQHLAAFLKRKGWGIRCCGKPAVPVWKKYVRPDDPSSGYMQLRHKGTPGRRVMHANAVSFPRIALVSFTSDVERDSGEVQPIEAQPSSSAFRLSTNELGSTNLVKSTDVFRRNLTIAMKAKGLSRIAVAHAARTSRSYVESVLNGRTDPSLSRSEALAAAVNCTLSELLANVPPAK
jgi:hypothetical protein